MDTIRQHPSDVEYHEAFASLRAAKNWFWWLLLLAVLVNLAAFAAVRFYPVFEDSPSFQDELSRLRGTPATVRATDLGGSLIEPATQPATTQPAEATTRPFAVNGGAEPLTPKARWQEELYQNLGWILPLAKALGLIMAVLLALSLLTSLSVSLSGRLGGAGYLASAFVWSLVLAAIFVPWSQAFTGVAVPGVLFGRAELMAGTAGVAWGAADVTWMDQVLYYARFAGYPVLALLIALVVQLKYARGFREIAVEVETK